MTDPSAVAAATVPLGHPFMVRPADHAPPRCADPSRPDPDRPAAVTAWEALLDAGLIANRNPPAPPAVVARREANDALFRRIALDRRRAEWQGRA